ncbi:MAG: hypothetical protein WCW13_03355 [archaeon]|jgi:hypothetical protein
MALKRTVVKLGSRLGIPSSKPGVKVLPNGRLALTGADGKVRVLEEPLRIKPRPKDSIKLKYFERKINSNKINLDNPKYSREFKRDPFSAARATRESLSMPRNTPSTVTFDRRVPVVREPGFPGAGYQKRSHLLERASPQRSGVLTRPLSQVEADALADILAARRRALGGSPKATAVLREPTTKRERVMLEEMMRKAKQKK